MNNLYKRLLTVNLFSVGLLFSQWSWAAQDVVTNNNNSGAGSLADAIASANARPGLDTVVFNIPEGQSFTITATFKLTISDSLFIDGYSQPGAVAADIFSRIIRINVSGTGISGTDPIFEITAHHVIIRGLAMYQAPGYAITITSTAEDVFIKGNYIGTDSSGLATGLGNAAGGVGCNIGSASAVNDIKVGSDLNGDADFEEGNLICASTSTGPNDGDGIVFWRTDNSIISGNVIGLNKTGTGPGFENARDGILLTVSSTNNIIGTNSDGIDDEFELNAISSNGGNGITFGSNSDNNVVAGNIIGLDANNDPAGNSLNGIEIKNSSGNRIGTDGNGVADVFERNIISGNGGNGIAIITDFFFGFTAHSNNNIIAGNIIGTDPTGIQPYGNGEHGILLNAAFSPFNVNGNRIGSNNDGNGDNAEGNLIVNNTLDGIAINTPAAGSTATGNRISRNITYNNTDLGIDMGNDGVSINDDSDGDTGPNELFNAPVISTVQIDGLNNLIVNGFTRPGSILEFYVADAGPNPNPLGSFTKSFGEGQAFLFRAQEEATLGGITDDSTGVSGTYDGTNEGSGSGGTRTETKFSFKIPVASLPVAITAGTRITAIAYDDVSGNTSEFGGGVSAQITPVTLTSFKGRISNSKAELTWTTSEEHDNSHFEIERSANGIAYSKVGRVVGQGGRNNQYSFTDPGPGKVNLYRLRQVDVDGKSVLSRVLVLSSDLGAAKATATPNPFTAFMNVSYKLEKEETIRIRLYDQGGRIVKQYATRGNTGINTINLNDLGNLPRGTYIIDMQSETISIKQKVVKQ